MESFRKGSGLSWHCCARLQRGTQSMKTAVRTSWWTALHFLVEPVLLPTGGDTAQPIRWLMCHVSSHHNNPLGIVFTSLNVMFHLPCTFIQSLVVPYLHLSTSGSKRSRVQFLWTSAEHSTLSAIALAIIINAHIQFDSL